MLKQKNSKGFTVVEALIVILIVAVLAFAGWYVWHKNQKKQDNKPANQTSQNEAKQDQRPADPYAGWKTYASQEGHFTAKYPADWTFNLAPINDRPNVISPSGTVVYLYWDNGGKGGGGCDAAPGDKPFTVGNACDTEEFLSREDSPINNLYYVVSNQGKRVVALAKPHIITLHHMDSKGTSTYGITLAAETDSEKYPLNEPAMETFVPYEWLVPYSARGESSPLVYAYSTSTDPASLTNADSVVVKQILQSVRLNID